MGFMEVFTRETVGDTYPASLANSVHFSWRTGEKTEKLNQEYGILFARAAVREDNTLAERGVQNPVLFCEDGRYCVLAEYVDAEGNWIRKDKLLLWTTKDFVEFGEQEEVERERYDSRYKAAASGLEIPDSFWEGIRNRWIPLCSVSADYPKQITLGSVEDLDSVTAAVTYSDGSVDRKRIDWDQEDIRALREGERRLVHGKIRAVSPVFPMAVGYADPVLFQWEGFWYFLATNDNVDDIGLFIRKADTVEGLFAPETEEHIILNLDPGRGFIQTFWAPEFHVIGGVPYILFAVSGEQWGPQCHMMRLKEGGDPACAGDWEEPIRVRRQNDRPLTEDGITLDMTYFSAGTRSYLVWSCRYGIGTPKDSGSMLFIAEADEKTPWVLASEPVLLSRPLYGWENNSGTINNEGPFALCSGDRIYLAYSGGDACGYAYAVGYLTALAGDDLLQVENWKKQPAPVLCSTFIDGIQGPGHNSFFQDADGTWFVAYHAQEREKYFCRCTTMHRVHFAENGFPMLNVAGERDVEERLRAVEIFVECESDSVDIL